MVGYFYIENFFNRLFDGLDPGIAKLYHFPCIGEDHMVMLPVKIGFLVLSLVFTKLMLAHQFAFQQKFYGIIKRGPAYPVVFVLHIDIERFYIKMFITVVNFLEYCVAFGCFSVPVVLKKGRKYVLYNFLVFTVPHGLYHFVNVQMYS